RPGSGGMVSLFAGEDKIGEGRIDRTVPIAFSSYAGMDVGRDNGLVVDRAYRDQAPYAFTGTVRKVVFDLMPTSHEAVHALHATASAHGVAGGAGA
ncbi:MAG TPA: hypothetical protein VK894_11105, partial [Jiangellales bacterium]|nr:hypothetical protein [Jiangellales bacterium]